MLERAKSYLQRVLDALRPEITVGTLIVVLEPGCASVFRDEVKNLLSADEDAKRLAQQAFLFSEFLEQKAPDWKPPTLSLKAVMHGHHHQKSLMGMESDSALLKKLGMEF